MRFAVVFLCLLALAGAPAHAADSASTEDTAKFLAGLPVADDSPLAALEATPAWRQHAAFFDATFARVDRTQIDKVKAWSAEHINVRRPTLFYFFSGPDFLYANAFFPDAETYVLAGLESSGPIPDVTKLPKPMVPRVLRSFAGSLRSILGLSFFQTKFMSGDFRASQAVSGTIPVLYIFMARSGKEVHSATLVQLAEDGEISTDMTKIRSGAAKGVKIAFSSPGGPDQTLYYFSTNVAGTSFKTSGLEAFCDKLGQGDSFVKSASYLLHGRDFADIRNFILKHSAAILQDDTGVPIYLYDKTWTLTPYGRYVGPIGLFARAYQPQLAALHRSHPNSPIDFSIGYRYRPHEASIVFAVKKPGTEEVKPAAKAAPKVETKPDMKPDATTEPKAEPKTEPTTGTTTVPKTEPKPAEASKPVETNKPADADKPAEASKPVEPEKTPEPAGH